MMMRRGPPPSAPLAALLLAIAGCTRPDVGVVGEPPAVIEEEILGWRGIAAPDDIERLAGVDIAWDEALARARESGLSDEVEAEGALLDPAAALPRPAPAPGSYTCRVLRFGGPGRAAFRAYPPFFCYVGVEDELLALTKQTGTERPGGYLYESEDPLRMVFLGSVALAGEELAQGYTESEGRGIAGLFERVDYFHYRLVVPWSRSGAKLDVIELTVSPRQPG